MKLRDDYEGDNLGGFRRCFPHSDPWIQEKYDRLLQMSVILWNDYNGTRPICREPAIILTQPIYPGGTAIPRTNAAYFNKTKALDLQTVHQSHQ